MSSKDPRLSPIGLALCTYCAQCFVTLFFTLRASACSFFHPETQSPKTPSVWPILTPPTSSAFIHLCRALVPWEWRPDQLLPSWCRASPAASRSPLSVVV